MKIKRAEWEALNSKVASLEKAIQLLHEDVLMQTKTGPVLMNVIVPRILDHLKVESRHGYHGLLPLEPGGAINGTGE